MLAAFGPIPGLIAQPPGPSALFGRPVVPHDGVVEIDAAGRRMRDRLECVGMLHATPAGRTGRPPRPGPTSTPDGPVGAGTETRLMTGRRVDIRYACPIDLDAVRDFYRRLSDTSITSRFFGLRRHLPDDELLAVVGDSSEHVTLLASIDGELIGIGELIIVPDRTEAEVAFVVADDHHREGVATLLLERLAIIADGRGIRTLTATVLPGNADMQLVFRTVGLTVHTRSSEGAVTTTLDLSSLPSLAAAANARFQASEAAATSTGGLAPVAGRPCGSDADPLGATNS